MRVDDMYFRGVSRCFEVFRGVSRPSDVARLV